MSLFYGTQKFIHDLIEAINTGIIIIKKFFWRVVNALIEHEGIV